MARPLRIQTPGSGVSYHGAGQSWAGDFGDNTDRGVFLETLGESCEKTGWRIHAYVLMDNHYHLLVETPEPNLVTGNEIAAPLTLSGTAEGRPEPIED